MKFLRKPAVKEIGRRPPKNPIWPNREAFFADAGLFTLAAAGIYSVNVVGALPGNEVIIFPMLPAILLVRGRRAFNREYFWFYFLTAGWLIGTLIADLVNGSPGQVRMKGVARVIFFAMDFTALAILLNDKTRRLIIFALGIAFLMFKGSVAFAGDLREQWKFGLCETVAILALLVSCHYYGQKKYSRCVAIAFALIALNLYLGARSQLVVQMIAAVLSLSVFKRKGGVNALQDKFKLVALLVLAAGAASLANTAIQWAAEKGLFDESTKEKFEGQAHGDLGVLVGGRPETLVAIQAIIDRPIIGHGSFPYDPYYMQLKQDIQYEHGYTESDEVDESVYPVIPTHSHLTMAWVESGVLGGICWVYISIIVLRALLAVSMTRPAMAPLYSYFMVNFLWDILYSPFGSVNRMLGAYFILLSYSVLRQSSAEDLSARRKRINFLRSHFAQGARQSPARAIARGAS